MLEVLQGNTYKLSLQAELSYFCFDLHGCARGIPDAMQAGKVDKFMSYVKPRLRGSAVHNYRDEAKAANNHYDTKRHSPHIHDNRLLLKAQPQQGKTGMQCLQHQQCIGHCKLHVRLRVQAAPAVVSDAPIYCQHASIWLH